MISNLIRLFAINTVLHALLWAVVLPQGVASAGAATLSDEENAGAAIVSPPPTPHPVNELAKTKNNPSSSNNKNNTGLAAAVQGKFSGLPLPRWAKLKASKINARVGPNQNYPIKYLYNCAGCPVKIIDEYENWRKIYDFAGREAWVLKNLLGPAGNVLILTNQAITDPKLREELGAVSKNWRIGNGFIPVFRLPNVNSRVVAKVENMAVANLIHCSAGWCKIRLNAVANNAQNSGAAPSRSSSMPHIADESALVSTTSGGGGSKKRGIAANNSAAGNKNSSGGGAGGKSGGGWWPWKARSKKVVGYVPAFFIQN